MTNILQPVVPHWTGQDGDRLTCLVEAFARHRRNEEEVFWLKENAELLGILECTGLPLSDDILAPYAEFYAGLEQRMGFFPQYYRFFLSLCLDLEDLGMPGSKGEALALWSARQGLADAELSDLQRAEARRLMQRRGIDPFPGDPDLDQRLHAFIDRNETFALPNRKAAYELTHIVFYLGEYGRRDPGLSPAALVSLEYAGLVAYLGQDADLMAEICIALRHAGATPPPLWEDWIAREARGFSLSHSEVRGADDYHTFLVSNWAMAAAGRPAFALPPRRGALGFHRYADPSAPLRQISDRLLRLGERRRRDWGAMRATLLQDIGHEGQGILARAEASSARFGSFFEGFARTGLCGVQL